MELFLGLLKKLRIKTHKIIGINAEVLDFITQLETDRYKEIFKNIFNNDVSIEERRFLE